MRWWAAVLCFFLGSCYIDPEFPSGVNPGSGGQAQRSVTITILQGATGRGTLAFGANPLNILTGTMVTWVNEDATAHSVVETNGVFNSGPILPGQSFQYTFLNEGTFEYFCEVHGATSESGSIIVSTVETSLGGHP